MAYRTITVEGKEFQYVVGKTHVKVKGLGSWPKERIGTQGGARGDDFSAIRVTPHDVKLHILSVAK